MSSNSVCNHARDKQIGRPRSMITDRIGLHPVLLPLLIAWGLLDFLDDRREISDNLEPKRRITNFTCPSWADLSLKVTLNSLQHGTKTNLVPRAFSLVGKKPWERGCTKTT